MNARASRSTRVVTVVIAVLLQLLTPLALGTSSPAQAAPVAPAAGGITLHVQSDRSVNNKPGFVHKGDPVATYKWIINVDDTGDPGTLTNQGT